jgi:phage baseplate assembly protein W
MNVQFPFSFDLTGRTAQTDLPGHISDMIEQILFTAPGERVNRPTFGCGVLQLVFAGNSDSLAVAQQQVIQSSLTQWLSDLIQVESVSVLAEDATLLITISYTIIASQEQQTEQFVFGGASS